MNVHGDKYDYSQVDYEGANIEVKIICKLHGIFQQQPSVHISGCGCNVCGIVARSLKTRSSTEEFILHLFSFKTLILCIFKFINCFYHFN
jgi:hypothetical protein